MPLSNIPGVINRGVVLNGLTSLPASIKMMTVDDAGNMGTQDIPVASFAALTGNPTDNAALASALAGKVALAGDTMTGTLTAPEYRSPRAGAMSSVNPQNQIVLYGGFSGYGIGFDGNGELVSCVNGALRSRMGVHVATGSLGGFRINATNDMQGAWDVQYLRNATGPAAEIRAAGGLRVCDAAGTGPTQIIATGVRSPNGEGWATLAGYAVGYAFNDNAPKLGLEANGVRVVGKLQVGSTQYWSPAFGSSTLDVIGSATVSGQLNAQNDIALGSGSQMTWASRGTLRWPATNIFRVADAGVTSGFSFDVSTNGTATLRNIDNTAAGNLNCGAITASSLIRQSSSAGMQFPSTGYGPFWQTSTTFNNLSDGVLGLRNFAETSGVSFDVTTDGRLRVANRTNSGVGSITCGAITSTGTSTLGSTNFTGQIRLQSANNTRLAQGGNDGDLQVLRNDATTPGQLIVGAITASGAVNATNLRCANGIMQTRYMNNANDTWSAFEFPASQNALTFSPGVSGLFRFEGTTSGHPALKRSGAALHARLGDDSAFAAIVGGDICHRTTTNDLVKLTNAGGEGVVSFGNNTNTTTATISTTYASANMRISVGGNNRLDISGSAVNVNNANFLVNGSLGNFQVKNSGAEIELSRNSINYIRATGASGSLNFGTGGTDGRLTISSSGAIDMSGDLTIKPSASVTPPSNGQLTFEATSDTSITVKYKGSDGVVRSNVLTLTL